MVREDPRFDFMGVRAGGNRAHSLFHLDGGDESDGRQARREWSTLHRRGGRGDYRRAGVVITDQRGEERQLHILFRGEFDQATGWRTYPRARGGTYRAEGRTASASSTTQIRIVGWRLSWRTSTNCPSN